MKLNKFLIFIVLFIGIVSFFISKVNYGWYADTDAIRYLGVSWHKIASSRLDGFTPNLGVVEKNDKDVIEDQGEFPNFTRYLRNENGGNGPNYWLEINNGSETKRINSRDTLKEIFGPVDNEKEAASFVSVVAQYLIVDNSGKVDGYTATVGDSYLVKVMRTGILTCGFIKPRSKPSFVVYKVSKFGDVEEIASHDVHGCS